MEDKKPKIFIIAGMPRAATTYLYYQLQKHPQIFAPVRKEVNYFGVYYSEGIEWYKDLYQGMADGQIGMDASPAYFMDIQTIKKMLSYDADIKVILGVRDPAEWAISFFKQVNTHGYKTNGFQVFLENHEWRVASEKTMSIDFLEDRVPSTIEAFKNGFGKNLLLYSFDAFNKNPFTVLKSIEHFLDLDNYFSPTNTENVKINASERTNIKFLTKLLSNETLINLIIKVLPNSLTNKLRNWYLKFSQPKNKAKESKNLEKEAQLELAQQLMKNQREYVNQLFNEAPIILGNSQSFDVNISKV